MRFCKGNKVEVLHSREIPSGCWLCAEIVSGNGHYYRIKYDYLQNGKGETIIEKVPRKLIRPIPPPIEITYVKGGVVEVFDEHSWKIAEITRIVGVDCLYVRILGSKSEFKVDKMAVRPRLCLKDNRWSVIRKDLKEAKLMKLESAKHYHQLHNQVSQTSEAGKNSYTASNKHFHPENGLVFQQSHLFSSRKMKRGSRFTSSQLETSVGTAQKVRLIEKNNRPTQVFLQNLSCSQNECERKAEALNRETNSRIQNNDVIDTVTRTLENERDDEIHCSVASCSSGGSSPYQFGGHHFIDPSDEINCPFDEAISFCGLGYEEKSSTHRKEEVALEIHRLELQAYRCTMKALYASGPLSWEQEALVTNLRLMLHISNDEHLLEWTWRMRVIPLLPELRDNS